MKFITIVSLVAVLTGLSGVNSFAQKMKPKPAISVKAKSAIFAVIYDGTGVEPIAFVEKGKLVEASSEADSNKDRPFSDLYYKPNSKYELIFGGVPKGTVTVNKSNIGTDCGGVSAEVTVKSAKVKLNGFLMGLATNYKPKTTTGYRRKPTAAERVNIEAIVHSEFTKQKVAAPSLKKLHSNNLTALDVDSDGRAEFVGSYWVAQTADQRNLLFFIAEIDTSGKYFLTYSDYSSIRPGDLMSGDLKDLDTMGGELLLDAIDYDNDGVLEVFTIDKAFEGNNYYVYKRSDGKWSKVYGTYAYRCGY